LIKKTEAAMGPKMCGLTRKAAVVGSLALVGQVGHFGAGGQAAAATVTLDGVNNIQATNGLTNSTYFTTVPPGGDGGFGVGKSFPYMLSKSYFTTDGAYDIVPYIKVKTSTLTLPAGNAVSGAELGLYFTDSTYYGGSPTRSDYVDLWSVQDEFTPASVNMTTYDGTNSWTDGFAAGINGWTRTGPLGRHLAQLWHNPAAPIGTPTSQINDNTQEYKVFKGPDFDAYLTAQILAGKDSYFALTNSSGDGFGLRFVAPSDVSWGGFLDNRPYVTVIDAPVPEPAGAATVVLAGAAALARRRRRQS
jgi:hypothetical protein